jgi:hypothetical protein
MAPPSGQKISKGGEAETQQPHTNCQTQGLVTPFSF